MRLAETHIFNVRSLPPLATLSATKSTQYTSSVWPGKSVLSLYVFKSQICSHGKPKPTKDQKQKKGEAVKKETQENKKADL